MVKEFSKSVNS